MDCLIPHQKNIFIINLADVDFGGFIGHQRLHKRDALAISILFPLTVALFFPIAKCYEKKFPGTTKKGKANDITDEDITNTVSQHLSRDHFQHQRIHFHAPSTTRNISMTRNFPNLIVCRTICLALAFSTSHSLTIASSPSPPISHFVTHIPAFSPLP